MKILFVDDCNGNESEDPIVDLLDVPSNPSENLLKDLEATQLGVGRHGGSWKRIMNNGFMTYTVLKSGRLSDIKLNDYDMFYKLISGNY